MHTVPILVKSLLTIALVTKRNMTECCHRMFLSQTQTDAVILVTKSY